MHRATAFAHPNIAFIKYWGNRDEVLRLPVNGSISMNLAELLTTTTVEFDSHLTEDELTINDIKLTGKPLVRVAQFLNIVRRMAGIVEFARVISVNNFPAGTGIASSASAFAALALAASRAGGLELDTAALSRLARLGSGSACRSIPGGFVEWVAGESEQDSYAVSIADADHWNLVDIIAIISAEEKEVGSTEGHALAASSPLQAARVADSQRRLQICVSAILHRKFSELAEIIELDSMMMHAVMMTSRPPLMYWQPATIEILKSIQNMRQQGLPAACTVDAGPNVHIICPGEYSDQVSDRLSSIASIQKLLICHPGGPASLFD